MSSTSRSLKQARTDTYQTSYHDSISLFDDFDTVQYSEGRVLSSRGATRSTRVHRASQQVPAVWEQASSWAPLDDEQYALHPDGTSFEKAVDADVMKEPEAPPKVVKKKKKSFLARRPHVVWATLHRQGYLDEILRWAGRGDFRDVEGCPDCISRGRARPETPLYRCRECFVPDMTCGECCIKRHRMHPFHRIQGWNGSHFVETSLKTLGLTIQLNHSGNHCENPILCHADLLVLHINGIHSVSLRYCGCARQIPLHLQLLRRHLYPASQVSPRTCATFELLRHLHKMSLATKASTYDFYRCLEKSTNNTNINPPKSRYRALLRMVLQWRHLQMLKWAGRGHDPTGVAGTSEGELGVVCPSCPHPGINLPENWRDAPPGLRFLYAMIICMDANFRLKNQLVSNYSQDPGLGIGWVYLVPRAPYEGYVLDHASDVDISTCVGFQALAKANNKFWVGLRYTGVNMAVCGRSEMIFPAGVGNLQKGERYSNMDYIFASVLRRLLVTMVFISYDIACQWFINLFKRMEQWPTELTPTSDIQLIPAIPKLHEPMHKTANHQVYSFNYIPGVGYTDGEAPERIWSSHNSLANSTKTQGPGSRQDVLDDHFGFWNWLKYCSTGATLCRRYRNAVAERNDQSEGFRGLNDSLPDDVSRRWERMCCEWDSAPFPKDKPNPYHSEAASFSEAQLKKELGDEEKKHLDSGGTFPHKTTTSMFIGLGLDLEEAQRRLHRFAKNSAANTTIHKQGSLSEQRNSLTMQIRGWEQLLPIYMPGLLQYQTDHPSPPTATASNNVEDRILWLPSRIPESHRENICVVGLPDIEHRMRYAQLADSLESIRQILKIKSRMIQFKNKNLRGQKDGTRSTAVIDRVHERARSAAAKYRAARVAYLELASTGEWEALYRVLEDGDIRGFQDAKRLQPRAGRCGVLDDDQVAALGGSQASASGINAEEEEPELVLFNEVRSKRDGTGEMRRKLSWIWTAGNLTTPDDHSDDIYRSEWAKARARTNRAKEEVMLLKEEMRWTLAFLEYKAGWWRDRPSRRSDVAKDLAEGLMAYSLSQAALQEALADHFRKLWRAPLDSVNQDNHPTDNEHNIDNDDEDNDEDEDDGDGDGEDHENEGGRDDVVASNEEQDIC